MIEDTGNGRYGHTEVSLESHLVRPEAGLCSAYCSALVYPVARYSDFVAQQLARHDK